MKYLLAVAALLISTEAIPLQLPSEAWRGWMFGAPCSTWTDIVEGTCKLTLKIPSRAKERKRRGFVNTEKESFDVGKHSK